MQLNIVSFNFRVHATTVLIHINCTLLFTKMKPLQRNLAERIGSEIYLKENKYVQYGGYLWPEFKGKVYNTLGSTAYPSESDAMNACKNNKACRGVSLIKKNTYKLGMKDDLKAGSSGVISYVKGDEIYISASKNI